MEILLLFFFMTDDFIRLYLGGRRVNWVESCHG